MQRPLEPARPAGSGARLQILVDHLGRHGASPLPASTASEGVLGDGCSGPVRACDPPVQALALLSLFEAPDVDADHRQWAVSATLWFDRLTDMDLRGWLGSGDRVKPTLLLALRQMAAPTLRCGPDALDAYLRQAQRHFGVPGAAAGRASAHERAGLVVQLVHKAVEAAGAGWRPVVPIPPAWSGGLSLPDAAAACLRRLAGAEPHSALAGHALARLAVLLAGSCEGWATETGAGLEQVGHGLIEALGTVACTAGPLSLHFGERVAKWQSAARVSSSSAQGALQSLSEAWASGEHAHDWETAEEARLGALLLEGGEAAARIAALYFLRELLERLWIHPKRPDGRLRNLLLMLSRLLGEHCTSPQTRQVAGLLTNGLGDWVGTPYAKYTAPVRRHVRDLPSALRLDLDSAQPRSEGPRLAGDEHVPLFQTIERLAARIADRLKDPVEWAAHPAMTGAEGATVLRLLEGRFRSACDQPGGRPLERAQLWRLIKQLHDGPLLQAYRRIVHETVDVLQGAALPRLPCTRCRA